MMVTNTIKISLGIAILIAIGMTTGSTSARAKNEQAGGQGRELHETYDLSPNGTVSVNNISGYIRVTTWNENKVKVDAVKQGRGEQDYSRVEIQVVANPDRIEIRTIYPRGRPDIAVDYDLKVPRGAGLSPLNSTSGEITVTGPIGRVIARSNSGDVSARDVVETASLSSSSGNVRAEKIGGEARTNSVSGNVTVNDVGSRLFARSGSGNITAIQIRDDATVNSASGNINLERVGGRAIARSMSGPVIINGVGGDVQADNLSNNVTVNNIRGRANVSAISGNLIIKNVSEGVRGSTVSGRIELSDSKGRVELSNVSDNIILNNIEGREIVAKSHSGNLQFSGSLQSDGRYEFETFSGNVTLALPPDSAFALSTGSNSGSVNTEFQLQLGGSGPVRMQGMVTGVVGRGGAVVRAVSSSGNVVIRKRVQ